MRRVLGCAGSEQAWLAEGLSGPAAPRLLSGTIRWSCIQWKSALGRVVPPQGGGSSPREVAPRGAGLWASWGEEPCLGPRGLLLKRVRALLRPGSPHSQLSVPKSWFPPRRPAHLGLEQRLVAWPPLQAWWAGPPWPVSGGCSLLALWGELSRGVKELWGTA